ncbi:MAG TPA: protein kinase [Solirubrobacteraceae bacterium]|nr:protein kinase [Solirubrobacteraceae bacterium]
MNDASLIAGRYELGERLGYGGMSTVQVALDRRLERKVAVKLLAEHLADDSQFISRFRREALAAARLVHPNIVQVFDFGLDEPSGRYYIVMEYIRGRSGAEILREEKRLGVADTLELVDGACRGLAHAHRMGVVHRDVKPGNILRSDDGAVKLADFGIAKAMVGQTSQITQAGSVLGTAAYLAPEQATGGDVGPAADLYGLGVVTYQLLAGRLPYDAASLTELALLQQRQQPPRLDQLTAEVPPALAAAVECALALDPRARYGSADEMRAALHDGARGKGPVGADSTAATAMLSSRRATAATRAVSPPAPRRLAPTPGPPVYENPDPPSYGARDARRTRPGNGSGAGRIVVFLLLAAVIAAVIAFAVGSSQGGTTAVKITPVTGQSTDSIVDQMNKLIDDNTR